MTFPGPTVSAVVPCYRYGRYLEKCAGSIVGQKGVAMFGFSSSIKGRLGTDFPWLGG